MEKEIEKLQRQFRIILRAAKMRSGIEKLREKKNMAVRNQDFASAAALRDKEIVVQKRLDEANVEMSKIYDEYFPEDSVEIEELL